ncbi:hypothetical protein [Microbulbifer guangxiensis]|uniref:hypothetical protein n=1 Tax=Microbulbifer guangxiensis TaxID=2904249 RepID=UPI001F390021|nr:hypothetical protein [Microbulbifer guangxiensis]
MTEEALIQFYLAHQWLVLPLFLIFVVGLAIFWFGGLVAALVALGNKQWLWGIPSIFLGPLTGLPYALLYGEAKYAKTLMLRGLALMLAALLLFLLLWFFTRGAGPAG